MYELDPPNARMLLTPAFILCVTVRPTRSMFFCVQVVSGRLTELIRFMREPFFVFHGGLAGRL